MTLRGIIEQAKSAVRGFVSWAQEKLGFSKSQWYRTVDRPSSREARQISSVAAAKMLEAKAQAHGLRGGHQVLGIRRDVWRRYLTGKRTITPKRMVRVAHELDLSLTDLPGYEPPDNWQAYHEIMPYAEYVARFRSNPDYPARENPADAGEIQRARQLTGSDFWVEVWGLINVATGEIRLERVIVVPAPG